MSHCTQQFGYGEIQKQNAETTLFYLQYGLLLVRLFNSLIVKKGRKTQPKMGGFSN